jgi:hypothetical protein
MTSDYRFWASEDVGWMISWQSDQKEKTSRVGHEYIVGTKGGPCSSLDLTTAGNQCLTTPSPPSGRPTVSSILRAETSQLQT